MPLVMNVICTLSYVLGPSRDVVSLDFKTIHRKVGAYSVFLYLLVKEERICVHAL